MQIWFAVACGAVSIPYLMWFAAENTINPEFFTASAQVIPVLLVALLVDVSRSEATRTRTLVWVIVYAFTGAAVALTSEASPGNEGSAAFAIVASSIIALAFSLILTILWGSDSAANEDERPDGGRHKSGD